ncbi:glycosyltransferase domain-containing protein [Pectobacterium versatile]|uniref:glycosyltransferase domain-containing protein n=1 Tax=Pectobacterium versatile TaxID=2488639 RepID=UPI001B392A4D|nr:glycosyltransferase domain-containing protein [Pectobacterium versatile]
MDKKKLVVYTALFGDYDSLNEPADNYDGCDFICFTDQKNLKSDIWEIKNIESNNIPANILNRYYKFKPHLFFSDYNSSLYIDSNIAIIKNPYDLKIKYLSNSDFLAPKHFLRDCIYEEAKECIILKKYNTEEIILQLRKYKLAGMPQKFGLAENNIILRNHNKSAVINLMELWWQEIQNMTKRDQLSLAYVLWSNDQKFNYMNESSRGNDEYFRYLEHKKTMCDSVIAKIKNKIEFELRRYYFRYLGYEKI